MQPIAPLPPAQLTDRERIEDSLMILAVSAYRIGHMLNHSILKHNESETLDESTNALVTGIQMFAIVQFSAFLDEWNNQFLKLRTDGIEVDKVNQVEALTQPAFDVINLFPGIRNYRNWLFAHNSRVSINGYSNVYRGNWISTLVVPVNINEFQLVARALQNIVNVAKQVFSDYFIPPTDFIARYTDIGNPVGRTPEVCAQLDKKMDDEIYGEQ